jgi:ABC-2 type transport system ATP-binding protein
LRELPMTLLAKKINSLLELFGILGAADQPISGYSKGMKQKVLISAALLHDPDVLILDEPESGLDVTAVLVLRSLILELSRRGKAILYSSHIMESVERVCSRVMVLHRGTVVADDSATNLRTLMARDSLEAVFAELVVLDNPARTAADIADVAALRA